MARIELPIDAPEDGAVRETVIVDPVDPESQAKTVHVPSGSRGVDRGKQMRILGTTRVIESREGTSRRQRPGDRTPRFRRRRAASKRFARTSAPLVETHERELVPDCFRHERCQDWKDQDPTLTGSARIEDDDPVALRYRVFDHGERD